MAGSSWRFPRLGKGHEAISCSTGSVAGRTEARDVPVRQEPVDDFIQSSIVVHFKLGRIFFLFFGITADTVREALLIWETPTSMTEARVLADSRVDMMIPV